MFHGLGVLEDIWRGLRRRKLLPQRKVAVGVEALPVARFLCLMADGFLCIAHYGGVMLGIIGAAEDLSVHNEVLSVLGILQLEITLCTGVANSAPVITATVGRTYLGAAS